MTRIVNSKSPDFMFFCIQAVGIFVIAIIQMVAQFDRKVVLLMDIIILSISVGFAVLSNSKKQIFLNIVLVLLGWLLSIIIGLSISRAFVFMFVIVVMMFFTITNMIVIKQIFTKENEFSSRNGYIIVIKYIQKFISFIYSFTQIIYLLSSMVFCLHARTEGVLIPVYITIHYILLLHCVVVVLQIILSLLQGKYKIWNKLTKKTDIICVINLIFSIAVSFFCRKVEDPYLYTLW